MYAGSASFLPVAMFVRDLREQVVGRILLKQPERLEATRIQISSYSWISYQISPEHPSHAVSMQYSGALNIKQKVQYRTRRVHHPDSHYVARVFKMLKRLTWSLCGPSDQQVYTGR